ncbi:uncharacterized protein LOC119741009 isoform X2 [Patiria miniata]|uniref:Uncharacterized protein n=1 Tax=Patiria miniata TaxID=46514 RepID=A0A914B8L7_PATMI|nr:uncharacterized protein LOC119741009 isoform X2 [Patiria miniata]
MGDEHPLTWTNSSSEGLAFQRINTKIADDIVMLFVIITSLVAAASGVMVIYGFWRSKRQHRRLRKVVSMDTNDFLLYAQIAQQEVSSAPCKTSLPFQMPYSGKNTAGLSSYPVIVPGPAQEPSSLAVTNASSPASTTGRNTVLPTVTPPPKSPGRPKLSTFRDGRRKSCTPEVRAQLDPFRTMVLLSSSSEDLTSDSD